MIPDNMSQYAIARLPGETDAQTRERVRKEGLPIFCARVSGEYTLYEKFHGDLEAAVEMLHIAKAGGYFAPYMDPALSNLANAERCAQAARDLIADPFINVEVVNRSDGFRIEVVSLPRLPVQP